MTAIIAPLACGLVPPRALSRAMPMQPERMYVCMQPPGWSHTKLGRRINVNERTIRGMLSGRSNIPDNLAAWLEAVCAIWSILTPDLQEGARAMECDRGKWVRYPKNFRTPTDEEAELLRIVANFHKSMPQPIGWVDKSDATSAAPDTA